MTGKIIILLISIILSGFFSSSELAFFSISTIELRRLVKKKVKHAVLVEKLKSNPHRLLSTILIGNNLVNIGGSAIATALAIDMFGNTGVGIATGIMTFLILVFGEIIPKSYATRNAAKIALRIANIMRFLTYLFYPLVILFDAITKIFTPKISKRPLVTEEELIDITALSEEEGSIKSREKKMIHKVFELDDIEVKEIMTPRPDVFALDYSEKVLKVSNDIIGSGLSRIPVYDKKLDNIKGVVYTKELISVLIDKNKRDRATLKDIMRKPFFVPENKITDALLREFQKNRIHVAIVVDEYGVVTGLVTIEDILEELVGDIFDETDESEKLVKASGKKGFLILGKADIEDVNEMTGLRIEDDEGYETISGYILEKIGKIPQEGESFEIGKLTVKILGMKGNRIQKVKVIKN